MAGSLPLPPPRARDAMPPRALPSVWRWSWVPRHSWARSPSLPVRPVPLHGLVLGPLSCFPACSLDHDRWPGRTPTVRRPAGERPPAPTGSLSVPPPPSCPSGRNKRALTEAFCHVVLTAPVRIEGGEVQEATGTVLAQRKCSARHGRPHHGPHHPHYRSQPRVCNLSDMHCPGPA